MEVMIGIFLLLLGLTLVCYAAIMTTSNIARVREEVLGRSVLRSMEAINHQPVSDGWTIVKPMVLNGTIANQAIFRTNTNRIIVISWSQKPGTTIENTGTSDSPDIIPKYGDKVVSWLGFVYDVTQEGVFPVVSEADLQAPLLLIRQPIEIKVERSRGIPHL